jgi:hypothetical protein
MTERRNRVSGAGSALGLRPFGFVFMRVALQFESLRPAPVAEFGGSDSEREQEHTEETEIFLGAL